MSEVNLQPPGVQPGSQRFEVAADLFEHWFAQLLRRGELPDQVEHSPYQCPHRFPNQVLSQ
jgi:hypothetical protein